VKPVNQRSRSTATPPTNISYGPQTVQDTLRHFSTDDLSKSKRFITSFNSIIYASIFHSLTHSLSLLLSISISSNFPSVFLLNGSSILTSQKSCAFKKDFFSDFQINSILRYSHNHFIIWISIRNIKNAASHLWNTRHNVFLTNQYCMNGWR